METIMKYRSPLNLNLSAFSPEKQKRIQASINLVNYLQRLFGYLILSDKKYADTKKVLENIVDDQGNRIIFGEEKDIGEFNLQFLERLQEGLNYWEGKKYDLGDQGMKQGVATNNIDLLRSDSGQNNANQLKKRQSYKPQEDEESIINKLFFGKKKEFITYYQAGMFKQYSEENIFSPIILDLSYKDLYSSWENNNTFYIEDFKDNNGVKTEAEKAGWLTKCPEVLMFQIQRVVYNKEKGIAEKLNTPFYFEKEIFIDRYLIENRAYILRNKPKLKALKKKRELIMQELQNLRNYEGSNFSILGVFGMILNFLNKQQPAFSESDLQEEKFSPKTQSILTGDNYVEVTDFTLDPQNQSTSFFQNFNQSTSASSSSSSIDLLSLFQNPPPPASMTPQSQNFLPTTIFDNKIDQFPGNQPTSFPNAGQLNQNNKGMQQNKGQSTVPPNINQPAYKADVGIQGINQMIKDLNSAKQNLLNAGFLASIQNLKQQINQLISSLENELKKTNKEIDGIYSNLKLHKYKLHAILIHQGFADSGHYFSYIQSQDTNKWYKFNDTQVQEEQEKAVMQQAVGDGQSSAYCLVYLKDQNGRDRNYYHTFQLMSEINFGLQNGNQQIMTKTANSTVVLKNKQVVIDLLNMEPDSTQNSQIVEEYKQQEQPIQQIQLQPVSSLVQNYLKGEILQQNRQQLGELQQFKQLQLADSIVENYSKRFSFINEYIRKTYHKNKKLTSCPPLTNFGVYLRWANDNVSDLLKVQLFDCAIREVSQQKMMLSDVEKNQILNNRLLNNLEQVGEFKSPGKIILSPKEYEFIHKEYNKYLNKVSCAHAILEAFNGILQNNIVSSFDYFHYIQLFNTNPNDYFFRMCRDMFKVILLKATSYLFEMANEPIDAVLKQIKFVILYSAKLPEGDVTIAQIHKILNEFMKFIGNQKLSQQREKIMSVIAFLQSYEKLQEQFKSYLSTQEKKFEDMEKEMKMRTMQTDKYFWKIEGVNMELEDKINKCFSQEFIAFHQNLVKQKKVLDINERIQLNYQQSTSLPRQQ